MGRPAEARTRRGLTPRQGHLIRTYLKIEGGSRSGLKKSPPLGDAALRQFSSCGRLLIAAKEKLKPGEFLEMTVRDLPFTERTAQRLMAIARDERLTERLTDATHGSLLPRSWRTLYELTRLTPEQFTAAISDGVIKPDMERRDITEWLDRQRLAEVDED